MQEGAGVGWRHRVHWWCLGTMLGGMAVVGLVIDGSRSGSGWGQAPHGSDAMPVGEHPGPEAVVHRQPPPSDGSPREGTATFTDLAGGGACSFPGEPVDNLHVGMSGAEYGTADLCGGYLDVVGPGGTVRAKITDRCVNCPTGQLDLSRRAFAQIADVATGRVPVSYTLVRNPSLTEPIAVRLASGSSSSWAQIQALDHGNPIVSLELETPDGWRRLVHTLDNFWTATNPGPGPGPLTVRITDVYGQSVVVGGIALVPDQVQVTAARLYSVAGGPPPTAAPAPGSTAVPATVVSPDAGSAVGEARPREGIDVVAAPPVGPPSGSAGSSGSGNEGVGPLFAVLGAALVTARLVARRRLRAG